MVKSWSAGCAGEMRSQAGRFTRHVSVLEVSCTATRTASRNGSITAKKTNANYVAPSMSLRLFMQRICHPLCQWCFPSSQKLQLTIYLFQNIIPILSILFYPLLLGKACRLRSEASLHQSTSSCFPNIFCSVHLAMPRTTDYFGILSLLDIGLGQFFLPGWCQCSNKSDMRLYYFFSVLTQPPYFQPVIYIGDLE